jgi:hypothetical protein
MEARRTRYELRVGTLVSEATLATFRIAVRWTDVRRETVYRFRLPADRDLTDVVHRLTERDVQVLEIRRCPEPRRSGRGSAPVREEARGQEVADPAGTGDGVVLPFRRGAGRGGNGSAG